MAKMDNSLIRELAMLRELPLDALRERYLEVFGEETTTRNKDYIFKRIAYRLQEKKYGGLTERARARAEALADAAPLRRRVPDAPALELRDSRLPPPGTVLRRSFKGLEHAVTVLEDGFEYQGERFQSLSVVAKKISGTKWNGFGFFGLLQHTGEGA